MSKILKHKSKINCINCNSDNTFDVLRKSASTKYDELGRIIGFICENCGYKEVNKGFEKAFKKSLKDTICK